jgi:O-antigen/teichoic acid export membrane protein
MSLQRNFLAGFVNSIWSALVSLAVVPLYLKYLGIEAYGLIGFYATTQALLLLLDLGLVPTINREVARYSASGNIRDAGKLLHTIAVVYWSMAGIIALLIVALAPLIAGHWLQSNSIPQQSIKHAVMLMGLVVACRWPIGLYQGALMGAQRLTVSSGVSVAMVTLGSLGSIAVLALVSPTIEAFFLWQAGVGLLHATTMRWAAWRIVGQFKETRFDVVELKRIWRFSVGMSGITVTALVFTQLDKLILSKMLGLKEFGYYMLATTVAGSLYLLITPIYNAVYPRMSALVVTEETGKLEDLYRLGTRLLSTLLFPLAMLFVICSEDLIRAWTGNPTIALSVAPLVSLLAVGTALHGVMFLPYALQLAYGITRLPLMINSILLVVLVPLIVLFTFKYGLLGGAMAWLVLHVLYVVLGTWLTHRSLLKGIAISWLSQEVGVPLIISIIVGLVGHYLIQGTGYSVYVKLAYGGGLALSATLLSFSVSPKLRSVVLNNIKTSN